MIFVHCLQRGQLWTGCADSGELCLWHTNHRRPYKRISLPNSSGITCMIRVKNQVGGDTDRVSGCKLLLINSFCCLSTERFSPVISRHKLLFPRSFGASGVGGLPWWRRRHCWVWRAAERPAAGDGPREPYCSQGAPGSHRQHPGTVLC